MGANRYIRLRNAELCASGPFVAVTQLLNTQFGGAVVGPHE